MSHIPDPDTDEQHVLYLDRRVDEDAKTDEFPDGSPVDDESTEAIIVDYPYPYPQRAEIVHQRKPLSPQAVQFIAVTLLLAMLAILMWAV